jgi:hypothetical protein
MKVAILSESEADEAAIRILLEGLLGQATTLEPLPFLHGRGLDAVLNTLPAVVIHLHYQTDAAGLVVVVDSDNTPAHRDSHEKPGGAVQECRLCAMRSIIADVQRSLRPRSPYGPLKTALGLAAPQIEAWYLVGDDPHVTEGAWISGQDAGRPPFARRTLKRQVYGVDRPPFALELERAKAEVKRIVQDGQLPLLEKLFPMGFGCLAREVRGW